MFGEMVGAVEFPQSVDVVHHAMIPVEPEVDSESIAGNLQR